jgi:leucyl/phenylalanyl-tRNA--protein transferase
MPYLLQHNDLYFPPVDEANNEGLLAVGGDLSVERLLAAYPKGIFPWYEGNIPLWWCPNPRFVLFPEELKISKSLQQLLKRKHFGFTVNYNFEAVIRYCQQVERPGQDGTWITEDIISSYTKLHKLGYAHSAETWQDGQLVGGLYGIRMGNVFFGESMFSLVSNASKFAFVSYMNILKEEGIKLIDCQIYTPYLESFGARMIDRNHFIQLLDQHIKA